MTRIELKFKIPYGATREILFQTAMRLSFKKKKKKTQDLIKRRNRLFTEQTGEKKKASATKSLKPKSYFPTKIHTHSDYRFFVVPSNTQIGLACSNLSNRRKKKKPLQQLKPLQRWKSPFIPCNRRFISYPASALQQ